MSGYSLPLQYFGNRGADAQKLLRYFCAGQKFETFYDCFCGSGTFTLAALQMQLAKRYVMSDSYKPLIALLNALKSHPQKTIKTYLEHVKNIEKLASIEEKNNYYLEIEKKLNTEYDNEQQVNFLFVNNFSKLYLPLIKNNINISEFGNLHSNFSQSALSLYSQAEQFSQDCHKNYIDIRNTHFDQTLKNVGEKDLVFMDPPYPELTPHMPPIYHRPEAIDELHQKLLAQIKYLNQHKISFIMLYGTFGTKEEYILNAKELNLGHYLRLGKGSGGLFNEYLEHVFVSENLIQSVPANIKGLCLLPYEANQMRSSQDIIATIKLIQSTHNVNTPSKEDDAHSILIDNRSIAVTQREYQVAQYLKMGYSAKQTAQSLNISSRTVEAYIDNLKEKAHCSTKLELIAKMLLEEY